ncbi:MULTISPECIES: hypothetical protein [Yersinia]|uniref:hypothetical protein n=1 Tax=Yersinia TaxID=629 RepID=UPI000B63AAFD|nr:MULTISPECIES: hypothetical protein [Yersinia]OWF89112.1 hypothetical protein B4914_04285 [Yersinia entomophaga]
MSSERIQRETICFDYMKFLSASCKKRWSFVDAIYGVMPIFGMVVKKSQTESEKNPQEQLTALALQVLSTQVSDETNMIRLIRLARQQGIQSLEVQLPYGLDIGQLAAISRQCSPQVALTLNGERLLVNLPVIQP